MSQTSDPIPGPLDLGRMLFDQQMWCWGQDVRREGGNALLLYGLERDAPPPAARLGPVYHTSPEPGTRLILAGFGLFCGCRGLGALYLARHDFTPRLLRRAALPTPRWKVHAVPPCREPETEGDRARAGALMRQALLWTADYEDWASQALGRDHRRRCVAGWFKPTVPADTMAAHWREIAAQYDAPQTRDTRRRR